VKREEVNEIHNDSRSPHVDIETLDEDERMIEGGANWDLKIFL
jgi:hypothetical protein